MSSASAQAATSVAATTKTKTLQGRIKELLVLLEAGNLEQPFEDCLRTMIKMVCFIHEELESKTPLDSARYMHIDGISGDIWTALNDIKYQMQQRIRLLNEIEKSLPKRWHNKDETPTASSYRASSDDPQQWIEAIEYVLLM